MFKRRVFGTLLPVSIVGAIVLGVAGAVGHAEDPGAFAIRNARIVPVSGPAIDNGTVVVSGGLITAVGASVEVPADAWVIDGKGLTVYPGLIDALTDLGLTPRPAAPGRRRSWRGRGASGGRRWRRRRAGDARARTAGSAGVHAVGAGGGRREGGRAAVRIVAQRRLHDRPHGAEDGHLPRPGRGDQSRGRARRRSGGGVARHAAGEFRAARRLWRIPGIADGRLRLRAPGLSRRAARRRRAQAVRRVAARRRAARIRPHRARRRGSAGGESSGADGGDVRSADRAHPRLRAGTQAPSGALRRARKLQAGRGGTARGEEDARAGQPEVAGARRQRRSRRGRIAARPAPARQGAVGARRRCRRPA